MWTASCRRTPRSRRSLRGPKRRDRAWRAAQYARISEPGRGQHWIQACGAAWGSHGDRPVPARSRQTRQRSFARLLGGGHLQRSCRDGAAIGAAVAEPEMALPFRLIYHEGYNLDLGEHVFPAQKYRGLRDRLLRTGFAAAEDFVEPQPATDQDILLVHSPEWVHKLRNGTLSAGEILMLEIPYSRRMVEAFWLAAGGSILAARLALSDGVRSE